MGFVQSLLLNITGQRTVYFIHIAFFTLRLKHSPMTAAGTITSEKYFEPNSALLEIPFWKCETFVPICSA